MQFEFTEPGLKSLRKLDISTAKKILKKIKYWESAENPLEFSKSIKGKKDMFRFRLDDWRIITAVNYDDSKLEILEIGHRSTIYD